MDKFIVSRINLLELMLEYCKTVLEKVSFDPLLFEKELTKSFNWLDENEKGELAKWSSKTFKIPPDYLRKNHLL